MAEIQLQHISKTYSDMPEAAVQDVTLKVRSGEIMALLGPSGCGKTTILRIIAGFDTPDTGKVMLDGQDVTRIPPEKRNAGMVFQDYALFPHLNVRGNIGFGLHKGEKRRQKVDKMIELVNLRGHENKAPFQLSGGQQSRVALARSLAQDPDVVLLDEPFSGLDADLRGRMQREITSIIKTAGTTAIFVTHDQEEAMTVSDRMGVLRAGTLEQVGSARDVYQHPETQFVAAFVGKSNILSGRIGEDASSVDTCIGTVPCHHTHGHAPGDDVTVCIRPCGFEKDEKGPIGGQITRTVYTGENTDAVLEVPTSNIDTINLTVHLHPEDSLSRGEHATFRILPYFVAVVEKQDTNTMKGREHG